MTRAAETYLKVNPITCDGNGICAELLPERVKLDVWGYPAIDGAPLARDLRDDARRAVTGRPALALALERKG